MNLVSFSLLFLFGMGRKCPSENISLPPRPDVRACIALSNGQMACGAIIVPAAGAYCRQPENDAEIVKWIDFAWEAVNGN